LKKRLDGHEQEEQTRTHTHQSFRHTSAPLANVDEDSKGHIFMDEIMEAQLPSKWKGQTIKLYDGSTDPDYQPKRF